MIESAPFPGYIPRAEEKRIRLEARRVHNDRLTRAVLLYGSGGVGKTSLVRELARSRDADTPAIWLEPIDVDDSEYWLLSNLEQKIVEQLDPDGRVFGNYLDYLSRFPRIARPRIGHETIVSHLGRIKRVFRDCYRQFVEESDQTIVITLDTVEAIRGMDLFVTLTQWIKSLPGTLFVLSGRPLPGGGDPIREELEDPHKAIRVITVELAEFSPEAAFSYLRESAVASALTEDEKRKLVLLTRGHPLWLALALDYLVLKGIPEEAAAALGEIERNLPLQGPPTPAGEAMQDAFQRRLVTPYRETDFWHEATKRLTVVRKNVSKPIWQRLMSDRPLPDGVAGWDEAWARLLRTPWIRARANRRYVTLHDALADELAHRIIPLHDQDQQWRRSLWQRAVAIYGELTDGPDRDLAERLAALDRSLEDQESGDAPVRDEAAVIAEVNRLDAEKRQLDQLKAARLYYQLLSDFDAGCRQFLTLLEQARTRHDLLFQNLIAMEMQRFLPQTAHLLTAAEAISEVISGFHRWLSNGGSATYVEIGLSIAEYLLADEQPQQAAALLEGLPVASATATQRFRRCNLLGNTYMRIPGRVREGAEQFENALAEATALDSHDRPKLIAEAQKELGFYYRNEGLWAKADEAYAAAHSTLSETLSRSSPAEDREEMASIQTNWAYVKGLRGSHREGRSLVESAIVIRRRLNRRLGEGISLSVQGELLRFEGQFDKAWDAYGEAERVFEVLRNWSWLGLLYQEQAMCLFQAAQRNVTLVPEHDQWQEAEQRITRALDICRDQAVRGYPSALNRAGRIFGERDFDRGLDHLREGVEQARKLYDGWFWFANMIEYAELSFKAWQKTGRQRYRDQIPRYAEEIARATSEYEFPDLCGRWELLQGHLTVRDALEAPSGGPLDTALQHFRTGFRLVAEGYVGSHGAAAIPAEFDRFAELFRRLPPPVQDEWETVLRRAWRGSTLLLAHLARLY